MRQKAVGMLVLVSALVFLTTADAAPAKVAHVAQLPSQVVFAAVADVDNVRICMGLFESRAQFDEYSKLVESLHVQLTPKEARAFATALRSARENAQPSYTIWGNDALGRIALITVPDSSLRIIVDTGTYHLIAAFLDDSACAAVADQIDAAMRDVAAQFLP